MHLPSLLKIPRDDEEALISPASTSSFHSTEEELGKLNGSSSMLGHALPAIEQSTDILETTLPPPPICKKKALLIGIQNYNSPAAQSYGVNSVENNTASGNGQLKGPHADVLNMRELLLDCYDFNPDDITTIIDDRNPEHAQPTKENLIQYMKDLVADPCPGDLFYLHFSGHGTQLPDDNGDEEDGLDECILTCDNETITDDILNQLLVAPLPVGSTFVSSFDSCHSGTMLDLKHYRCNQVYVPWVNKGVRRTTFIRNIVARHETQISIHSDDLHTIQTPVIRFLEEPPAVEASIVPPNEKVLAPLEVPKIAQHPNLSISTHLAASWADDQSATPLKFSLSPRAIFCTGRCREEPDYDVKLTADVISISATKDNQLSWEDCRGSPMTAALIKVLRKDPHSSLKHIMTFINHELHSFYIDLHNKSLAYKKFINSINIKRKMNGKQPWRCKTVEMNNFQDPQISSHHPLDMDRPWPL